MIRLYDLSIRVKNIGVTLGVLKRGKRKFPTYKITGRGRRKVNRGTVPFYRLSLPPRISSYASTPFCLTFLYKRRNKVSQNEKRRLWNNIFSVSLLASPFTSCPYHQSPRLKYLYPRSRRKIADQKLKFVYRYRCPCLRSNRETWWLIGNFVKILAKIHSFCINGKRRKDSLQNLNIFCDIFFSFLVYNFLRNDNYNWRCEKIKNFDWKLK